MQSQLAVQTPTVSLFTKNTEKVNSICAPKTQRSYIQIAQMFTKKSIFNNTKYCQIVIGDSEQILEI